MILTEARASTQARAPRSNWSYAVPMPKWENIFERLDLMGESVYDRRAAFNRSGSDGWEFIDLQTVLAPTGDETYAVFKRLS